MQSDVNRFDSKWGISTHSFVEWARCSKTIQVGGTILCLDSPTMLFFVFFHYDSIADTFELLKLDVGNTIKYIL